MQLEFLPIYNLSFVNINQRINYYIVVEKIKC